MGESDEEFLQMLRATFQVEATELLQTLSRGLVDLEKAPPGEPQREIIATVFRAAHSLKGAARAVDLYSIESSCQSLEDLLAGWKQHSPVPGEIETAWRTLDAITGVISPASPPVAAPVELPAPPLPPAPPAFAAVAPEPAPAPRPASPPAAPPSLPPAVEPRAPVAGGTVRVSVAKLDAHLTGTEEMLLAKQATTQRVRDLHALAATFDAWRREWSAVEPDTRALREQMERARADRGGPAGPVDRRSTGRIVEYLESSQARLRELEARVGSLTRQAEQDRYALGKLVDDLLEDSKKLLLLPFGTLTGSFPKLVRDVAHEQGKDVQFVIRGEEVEMDKRMLEEMKDPLIHLLRNCLDHGIESPARRAELGKPARATLTLAVSPAQDNKIELRISDDGAGIDTGRVKASAIKRGLLTAEEASHLDEAAAQALIFQPEVSTSATITRLSGRGLGMAIVRENAEKLGGTVAIESRIGKGTTFRILLPATLATFRGILIEAEARRFIVPTFHTERVARIRTADVKTVENRETIVYGGAAVSLVRLADVLQLPPAPRHDPPASAFPVLILGTAEQRIAFAVDAVLDEQEILAKPLRKPLVRVRHFSGATVLPSGQVAPILHVADLLKSARRAGAALTRAPAAAPASKADSAHHTILVAEDSITSRTLIKGILEAAGFTVKTAVDGMDAFTALRAGHFDLLVSDVEMPRLNGFDLTARVRADRRLAELPVILVTALETREDRERGIDVGANAYLTKGSFDEGSLLATIRQLIGT